ncbi:ribulokinase [Fictibacillus sp. KIGAM418]|uniref:Ribulokinase n=1 Tax=Fictibacillus marinisediminis TaxID=2878389 RepID=A0A9X2BIN3_9BACL|nr:ribulokinase [Fictibacillus marinisediminis]MCK6258853.1 ribulokinase [Fictibacillus marinisediminis]
MQKKYVIGIDYGTESGRVLLVEAASGEEIATNVTAYRHGVMDEELPGGTALEADWALQHPGDYFDVLRESVPAVLQQAKVSAEDVIGLGIDFTSSTIMPLTEEGEPLCLQPDWEGNPHSWVKLWKHHAAQSEADELTKLAEERNEGFLKRYGGKASSEWMFPKILQILREAPDVFEETDLFMEAGDWVTSQLAGNMVRSSNTCGYKAFWNKEEGYPSAEFFSTLDMRLENILDTKMRGPVLSIGEKAGELTEEMARLIGLEPGIAVAVGIIDAHAGVPAVGAVNPGQLVMAMGTSTCHMLISDVEEPIKGVCGIVEDGIIPGCISYETGQVAVGDSFAWYVDQAVPDYVKKEAADAGMNVHQLLEKKAAACRPGQSGLVALDWWNGNRSVLVDAHLSGAIVGLTLATKPEEIYRALLESTAFGTKKIIESFVDAGVAVDEIFAVGGLPERNHLLMQIYADVTNREIKIANSRQTTALGAAMYAAVAAGREAGGYDSIFEAADKMARVKEETFKPIPENVRLYEELYRYYLELHDFFGQEKRALMHGLKRLKSGEAEEVLQNGVPL